ncbi:hypothetical protein V6N12_023932 [Hibiscus sabdariffa]|uniref:Uncharacterized protein n=1 Tax=Hibiscus sabdariffa TaxID=183260 RepID=A0ABR2FZJ7_9ROSI
MSEKGTLETDSWSVEERSCCIDGVDFVTLRFHGPLQIMPPALRECFSVLKPGGMLLFRDYGLYDMTLLRFETDQRVGFREYMRSDGTRSSLHKFTGQQLYLRKHWTVFGLTPKYWRNSRGSSS